MFSIGCFTTYRNSIRIEFRLGVPQPMEQKNCGLFSRTNHNNNNNYI